MTRVTTDRPGSCEASLGTSSPQKLAGGSSTASFGQLRQAMDQTRQVVDHAECDESRLPGRRRAVRSGVATIAALTLTACATNVSGSASARTHAAAQPSPSALRPPLSSPADVARQQAIAAYLGMWRNFADAATTSDWRSPALAQNATGDALSTLSRGLYADHYNGLVSRGRPVNTPEVSSVDPVDSPTTVVIADCGDSTTWTKYRADNGQPVNDGPSGRRQINAIVKKAVDGSWKVTDFGVQAVGTC
jgi:hypothetical protein